MDKVYWLDECRYCKNREGCKYRFKVEELRIALARLEKSYDGVYGSLKWYCDYFSFDKEKYWEEQIGEMKIG